MGVWKNQVPDFCRLSCNDRGAKQSEQLQTAYMSRHLMDDLKLCLQEKYISDQKTSRSFWRSQEQTAELGCEDGINTLRKEWKSSVLVGMHRPTI